MTVETERRVSLPIRGMTCASCVAHVTHALEDAPGVGKVNVNLATEKATLDLTSMDVPLDDLVERIGTALETFDAHEHAEARLIGGDAG